MGEVELELERARHREEQVDVDEGAGSGEEDLLDDHPAQDSREARAWDHRDERQNHYEGSEVRREEPVERHACRVGSQHLQVRDLGMRKARAQDEVPSDGGEGGLHSLDRPPGEEVAERDLGQRVPDTAQPITNVDADDVQDADDEDDPNEPRGHLAEPAPARRVAERQDVRARRSRSLGHADAGASHGPRRIPTDRNANASTRRV